MYNPKSIAHGYRLVHFIPFCRRSMGLGGCWPVQTVRNHRAEGGRYLPGGDWVFSHLHGPEAHPTHTGNVMVPYTGTPQVFRFFMDRPRTGPCAAAAHHWGTATPAAEADRVGELPIQVLHPTKILNSIVRPRFIHTVKVETRQDTYGFGPGIDPCLNIQPRVPDHHGIFRACP